MFKKYFLFISLFLNVFHCLANEKILGLSITNPQGFSLIKNENFEPRLTQTFTDKNRVIYKIQKFNECDFSCASEKIKSFKNDLKNKQSVIRDPYYGKITKGFTDCIPISEIDKELQNNKEELSFTLQLFANKSFVLFVCRNKETEYLLKIKYLFCRKNNSFYSIRSFVKKSNSLISDFLCE